MTYFPLIYMKSYFIINNLVLTDLYLETNLYYMLTFINETIYLVNG